MLELNNIDLDEIADALEDQEDYEHLYLIHPDTGEIAHWTPYTGIDGHNPVELDDLDHIGIRPLPSYVWYQDMADFTEQVSDDKAARRLSRAIDGKGAFRRFRIELTEEYPDLLPVWYAFRATRARRRAVEWLEDNELIDHATAARYNDEHPDPSVP